MMLPPRTRDADDPSNGPLVLRRELLARGVNDSAIQRLLRRGDLLRVREGAFVAPEVWAGLDAAGQHRLRARAVLRQARTPLVLSHLSGLAEWDVPMWGFDLSRVHATRTDSLRGRSAPDVVTHSGRLHAGDLVVVNGVPTMHPARLVLEAMTHGHSEAAYCALVDVLHRGLATPAQVDAAYATIQTWPDTLSAEVLVRLGDPRPESIGEARVLFCCYDQGLPKPIPQFEIKDATGRVVARVDFAWPAFGVFLEFDGRIKYEKLLKDGQRASDVVLAERDRERMICRLTGWTCIRVTWADLANPARLADRIRRELAGVAA